MQGCRQGAELVADRGQAKALRALCVSTNEALAKLQSEPGLSDWDRQHCADLGAVVLEAARRIDARAPSLPEAPEARAAAQAGPGARVSTLPGGASVAWSQDGRTLVVRF